MVKKERKLRPKIELPGTKALLLTLIFGKFVSCVQRGQSLEAVEWLLGS